MMFKRLINSLLKPFSTRFKSSVEMHRKGNTVTLMQNGNVIVMRRAQFDCLHGLVDLARDA